MEQLSKIAHSYYYHIHDSKFLATTKQLIYAWTIPHLSNSVISPIKTTQLRQQ